MIRAVIRHACYLGVLLGIVCVSFPASMPGGYAIGISIGVALLVVGAAGAEAFKPEGEP